MQALGAVMISVTTIFIERGQLKRKAHAKAA